MQSAHAQLSRFSSILVSVFFVLSLSLPGALFGVFAFRNGVAPQPVSPDGAVTPAIPPSLLDALEAFRNHYGLREVFIRWHTLVKVKGLHSTTTPRVRLGSANWLFFGDEGILEFHRHAYPFTEDQLAAWGAAMKERQNWLATQNRRYALIITPDKHSIYAKQFLPQVRTVPYTRTDQLVQHLNRSIPDLPVIDLREEMTARAKDLRMYHRTDTHWNGAAGWYSARHVAAVLNLETANSEPPGERPMIATPIVGGDLARILGMPEAFSDVTFAPAPLVRPLFDQYRQPVVVQFHDIFPRPLIVTHDLRARGTALIIRDSFGEALIPYLSRYFRKTVWVWSYDFSKALVEQHRPDIVITQFAERKLFQINPIPFLD